MKYMKLSPTQVKFYSTYGACSQGAVASLVYYALYNPNIVSSTFEHAQWEIKGFVMASLCMLYPIATELKTIVGYRDEQICLL